MKNSQRATNDILPKRTETEQCGADTPQKNELIMLASLVPHVQKKITHHVYLSQVLPLLCFRVREKQGEVP